MQIESLEASAFYKVCIDKYRSSVLQKCTSKDEDKDEDKDGRWIMCVPQSRSLGRRITRDDVGTLRNDVFFLISLSLSLCAFHIYFVCHPEKYSLSLSFSLYMSLIHLSFEEESPEARRRYALRNDV